MQVRIANHGYTIIWEGVYYFALSDYPHISAWELKKLLTFIEYENRHGRHVEIVCEDKNIMDIVNYAIAHSDGYKNVSLPNKITECTYCNDNRCITKFVCHTAAPDNAKKIFTSGKLLSAVKAFNKTGEELAADSRNAAGDPADYFDYIMFSWGNCTAGDNLVMERLLNRGAKADELENALMPGIRFYFRYADIIGHYGYVFDGYHPAKIKDELLLSDYLHACIIPKQFQFEFTNLIQSEICNRVYYLEQNGLGLKDWTGKVYNFVKGLGDNN